MKRLIILMVWVVPGVFADNSEKKHDPLPYPYHVTQEMTLDSKESSPLCQRIVPDMTMTAKFQYFLHPDLQLSGNLSEVLI